MKIRKLVKKINQSLSENPKDWKFSQWKFNERSLSNSRGLDVFEDIVIVRDVWNKSSQLFFLTSQEMKYLGANFNKLAKHPNQEKVEKVNKRRAWLVREILKTL